MNLKIFTTSRQIRRWLEGIDNSFLDKHYTIGEFLKKIVVVDNKKFIDEDLRKKYLFEAVKNVDLKKLGISDNFADFFYDSDFIFSFFNEMFLERANIDNVILNDVYLDYEIHLNILKEILNNYKALLEKDGYIDRFLIEDFRINKGLLEGIKEIELKLDGYLSRFDIEVLEKIDLPIKIYFNVDKFNKSLIEKSLQISLKEDKRYVYDFKNRKILKEEEIISTPNVEVEFFSDRIKQIDFIFAKIYEFVEDGINPDRIAIILPDESFSEFIRLFDEYNNINFAMGESFCRSNIYITLKSIYNYLTLGKEIDKELIEEFNNLDLIDFIRKRSSNKEMKVIEEELFKLERFKDLFKDKKEFLYFVLEKLKNKSFDDVYSGKITCMGVLESRGIDFDGVILVDFNEGIVPNVSDNDMFLNTFIRKHSNLPTRNDKENLQKHYYFELINSSKRVAISYVKNEDSMPSRFLYELGLDEGINGDKKYKKVILKEDESKDITIYDEEFKIEEIYPTTLKTLLECPKKYYFSHILGIKNDEKEEEFFGTIFHDSIKEISFDFNSSKEYYDALREKIISKIESRKIYFDFLVKWDEKLKKFCNEDFNILKNTKSYKEKVISFDYEGKTLKARVDRINENEKEVILIDYKTSKDADKKEKYIYEFQTTFYYLYAKSFYKDKSIKTYIWDINNSKLIEGVIKEDILRDVLNNLPNRVKEAEDIIVDNKIVKKATDICKYCEYKVACGRDL